MFEPNKNSERKISSDPRGTHMTNSWTSTNSQTENLISLINYSGKKGPKHVN